MRALARWRPWHVSVVCAGWLLLAPLLLALGLLLAGRALDAIGGRQEIELTVKFTGWSVIVGFCAPPALLLAAWLRARSIHLAAERREGVG